MSDPLVRQAKYWNGQAQAFQQIYARGKPGLPGVLDRGFRRDMYERFAFTMDASEPAAGRTFLDVGCGSGVYCLELADAAVHAPVDIGDESRPACAAEVEGLDAVRLVRRAVVQPARRAVRRRSGSDFDTSRTARVAQDARRADRPFFARLRRVPLRGSAVARG